jgi:hypothetical protein
VEIKNGREEKSARNQTSYGDRATRLKASARLHHGGYIT